MSSKLSDTRLFNGEEVTSTLTAKVPAIEFQAVCDNVSITVKCPWSDIVAMDNDGVTPLSLFLSNSIGRVNTLIDFKEGTVFLRRA